MFSLRNDFSKVGLRSLQYFKEDRLKDKYDFVLSSISCYNAIHEWTTILKRKCLLSFIGELPELLLKFPLYTYLRKHGEWGQSGAFELSAMRAHGEQLMNHFEVGDYRGLMLILLKQYVIIYTKSF